MHLLVQIICICDQLDTGDNNMVNHSEGSLDNSDRLDKLEEKVKDLEKIIDVMLNGKET